MRMSPHLKYLGLTLDSRWNFHEHLRRLCPRLVSAAAALGKLLPNVGGPSSDCRRLFAGVIRSMALYGAPIWAEALTAKTRPLLRRPQRIMAVRAIRRYRTASGDAACALAGAPQWELEASVLEETYRCRAEARDGGERPSPEELASVQRAAKHTLRRKLVENLQSARYRTRTIQALHPVLADWKKRKFGSLTYRLVQMLTGHGCFGDYLHKIAGREATPECHECGAASYSVHHILEVCPACSPQRTTLVAEMGSDLSLPRVVKAIADKREVVADNGHLLRRCHVAEGDCRTGPRG
ncbi:uncharacterized protein LOC113230862 [Hyposmocoma kahamanoa]|uniref:uncharacterized protein LOC113230862 n=1 Tax=Hyposmocoma kahamanoa TaxID=1477025 RepID=UPI000E6D9285|nr:uncharacterized protein LOC113230862 [Hyposmocoma kahamanoa]